MPSCRIDANHFRSGWQSTRRIAGTRKLAGAFLFGCLFQMLDRLRVFLRNVVGATSFSAQGGNTKESAVAQQNQGGQQGGQGDQQDKPGQQTQKPGQGGQQQGGSKENNPGNFANDPEKASEAGRKGGQS
jgi:general stress protein YciG